jgi:uncharacterized membrane protein YoaK (UPF0700 family)
VVPATSVLADIRGTVWPRAAAREEGLPPLLVLLTVVTGLVDAASYLRLGHVFVANMTGNVVFLGFALAGAPGLSVWVSLVAIGSFLAGGVVGGRIRARLADRRGALLRAALALQLVALLAAFAFALAGGDPLGQASRYAVVAALAVAMGIQNASARRLAVAELTTSVLTMTLTGIAADSPLAGGSGARAGRRLVAVAAMFAGALGGAVLVLHVDTAAPIAAAAGLVALTWSAAVAARSREDRGRLDR